MDKERLEKVKHLRKIKSALRATLKQPHTKSDAEYRKRVNDFCKTIYQRNDDYEFISNSAFSFKYEELVTEYDYLSEWENGLYVAWIEAAANAVIESVNAAEEPSIELSENEGQLEIALEEPAAAAQQPEQKVTKNKHGGARPGAGRKGFGVSKPVKIALPKEEWEFILELVENGHVSSLSEYFRRVHYQFRGLEGGD